MVEMAIMLPLLLLILFAIIDFGRVLGAYMLIHDLARDGARTGVVGGTDTEIKNHIINNDSFLGIVNTDITIFPATRAVGESLTVRIDYDMDIMTPIISSLVPDPFPLSAQYVMRIELLPYGEFVRCLKV